MHAPRRQSGGAQQTQLEGGQLATLERVAWQRAVAATNNAAEEARRTSAASLDQSAGNGTRVVFACVLGEPAEAAAGAAAAGAALCGAAEVQMELPAARSATCCTRKAKPRTSWRCARPTRIILIHRQHAHERECSVNVWQASLLMWQMVVSVKVVNA